MLKANHAISILRSEQAQNAELIGQYEDALGTATEQIRTYCTDHTTNTLLAQRRHYNALLQAEKDEHFQSRLDRDRWHAQTLRVCAMLRTAHRLRVDEDADQVNVVMALQNQVRVLRRALDLEVESPEAEAGWSVLRHCQDENDNDDDDAGGRLNEDDEEAARISTSADENFTASAPAPVPASVLPTRLRHTASTRNLNHNLVPSTTSRTTTASSTDTTTDTSPSEDDDSFDFSVAPTSSVSSNLSSASVSMLSSLSPSVLLPKQSSQQQQQQHNQQPHTQGG